MRADNFNPNWQSFFIKPHRNHQSRKPCRVDDKTVWNIVHVSHCIAIVSNFRTCRTFFKCGTVRKGANKKIILLKKFYSGVSEFF